MLILKKLQLTRNLYERMQNNTTAIGRLVKGLSWNIIGLMGQKIFTMLSVILVARILGATVYGEFGIINNTISMFATFAGLGLGITSTKIIAEFKRFDKAKVERVLGLTNLFALISGIVMMIFVFILSNWLAVNVLNNPGLEIYLKLSSICLLFNTFNGVQRGALSGFEKFSNVAKTDIKIGIITCCLTIFGTYFYGLLGLVIVNIVISIITNSVFTILIRKTLKANTMKINYREFHKEFRVFVSLSLPSMLSGAMVGPVTWLANTIFVRIPDGYTQMGVFNAANQWRQLLMMLPQTFSMVMLPILVSTKNDKDHKVEKINMWFSWIVVIILSIPLINIPDVLSLLYGNEYMSYDYTVTMVLIVLVALLLSYKAGVSRNLVANNLVWYSFADNFFWGIILILSAFSFREMGSIGIALSFLIAYVINTIVFFPIYIKKKVMTRSDILSKGVAALWIIIIIQALFTVLATPLTFRLGIMVLNMVAILCFAYFFLTNKMKVKNK